MRKRRNKYRAQRTEYKGHTYDSKAEAAYAAHLDTLVRIGQVDDWEPHPKALTLVDGATRRETVTYRPDFLVKADGRSWYVDVKGKITPVFRLKLILFRQRYPEKELRIVSAKTGLEVDLFATKRRRKAA